MTRSAFIADLHLQVAQPEIIRLACEFLKQLSHDTDQLFILGDLVEYWIGDDAYDGHLDAVFDELAKLPERGCKTWLMHGNRDFLIGEQLTQSLGITLLPADEHIIEVAGQQILLMHGDTLCTDDVDYLAMRKQLRSVVWQRDFLQLPVTTRIEKAQQLRKQSRNATSQKAEGIVDVNQQAVLQQLSSAGVSQMIHGHTHRPNVHRLKLPKQMPSAGATRANGTRWVLGDWRADGAVYAIADEQGVSLKHWPSGKAVNGKLSTR